MERIMWLKLCRLSKLKQEHINFLNILALQDHRLSATIINDHEINIIEYNDLCQEIFNLSKHINPILLNQMVITSHQLFNN